MMVHVMAGPPQRSLLHGGRPDERPDETGGAIHLERAMGEVSMERQREPDRAQEVRGHPQRDQTPGVSHEEDEECRCLDGPENGGRQNMSQRSGSSQVSGEKCPRRAVRRLFTSW